METYAGARVDLEDVSSSHRRGRMIACAALTGLLALALGLIAHAASGGALPSAPILLAVAAFTVLASTIVAQWHPPIWCVMLLLGAGQQVLHWVLGGLGGAASSVSAGVGHHGEGVPSAGSAAGAGHSPEVMLMLHTHLAVALLVGWGVARHEFITDRARRILGRKPSYGTDEGAPIA
ncbi:hypothetical protein GM708_11645 [Vibrio cholerae]|jgi:hypothetical protein|nr:hypothetical protein [Vibrio cholerae]